LCACVIACAIGTSFKITYQQNEWRRKMSVL
jgi:hypothetical protein